MKIKTIAIIIILVILGGGVTTIKLLTKEKQSNNEMMFADDNIKIETLNTVDVSNNITNNIDNNIQEVKEDSSNVVRNEKDNVIKDTKEISKTSDQNSVVKNNAEKIQEKVLSVSNEDKEIKKEQSNVKENKDIPEKNDISSKKTESETKKEDSVNTSLANTTYRKPNKKVIKEVINILNDEISKNGTLIQAYKDGIKTQALEATSTNAYKKTSPFTYMYVVNINKGKVDGNYKIFENRVRNMVGAFGDYYVYAEDEYTYDSKGKNSYWSQTLVWIYII